MCAHSWGGGIIVHYNVPYNYTTKKVMSFLEEVGGGNSSYSWRFNRFTLEGKLFGALVLCLNFKIFLK
jgi:hypothetical protein